MHPGLQARITCTMQRFKVYLARPRGFCAGVDRAIDIVEIALRVFGPPVYVRHAIVHNQWVVDRLREQGAVFVEDLKEVPPGAVVVFSAHGVSPKVWEKARARGLRVLDATCPLVMKVHHEARRFAREGYTIFLIGHRGHVEVEGTMGEAPDRIVLIETVEDAQKIRVENPEKVAVITQTTLSLDDTREIIRVLKERFPALRLPSAEDICYATQNRQDAVKVLARKAEVVLVIGSFESSNSNRLREVAEKAGARGYLVPDASYLQPQWFEGVRAVGVTSGASTPEALVHQVLRRLQEMGGTEPEELVVKDEHVTFTLPQDLVQMAREKGLDLEQLIRSDL